MIIVVLGLLNVVVVVVLLLLVLLLLAPKTLASGGGNGGESGRGCENEELRVTHRFSGTALRHRAPYDDRDDRGAADRLFPKRRVFSSLVDASRK